MGSYARRKPTAVRRAVVVLVHVVVGMPAGAATLAVGNEIFLQPGPIDLHTLFVGIVFSPLFAIMGALTMPPIVVLPLLGGIAAVALHGVPGGYRWWTAALAGAVIGVGASVIVGTLEPRSPRAETLAWTLVVPSVVAMLACLPATVAILGGRRRVS